MTGKKMCPRMLMDKVYHCALDDTIDVLEEITAILEETSASVTTSPS